LRVVPSFVAFSQPAMDSDTAVYISLAAWSASAGLEAVSRIIFAAGRSMASRYICWAPK